MILIPMPTPINLRVITKVLVCVLLTGFVSAEMPGDVLDKLASGQFKERQSAYAQLEKWAEENTKTSPEALHKAWLASEDPEVKSRCYSLMKGVVIKRRFGKGKGFVGVQMEEIELPGKPGAEARAGVQVKMILPKTPAQKYGLAVNDVVVAIDEVDLSNPPKEWRLNSAVLVFSHYVQSKQAGDTVTLHIVRGGKRIEKKIVLMKRPASADVDPFGRHRPDGNREAERFFKGWLKEMGE